MRETLDEIAIRQQTDMATVFNRTYAKPHGYAPHLERFFSPLRDKPIKMLEIGVGGGESIKTWIEYFPDALVFGADIVQGTNPWDTVGAQSHPRYRFVPGDQASADFWMQFHRDHGGAWDIIIDDGGHEAHQIQTTFAAMWRHINYGGYYVIEDLGYAKPLDIIKHQIDRLNADAPCEVYALYCARELAIIQKSPI